LRCEANRDRGGEGLGGIKAVRSAEKEKSALSRGTLKKGPGYRSVQKGGGEGIGG